MSHFTTVKTSIKDPAALVEALVACGIPREKIEVHAEPKPLFDYHGRRTSYCYKDTQDDRFKNGDVAHVIVRQATLNSDWSNAHNDMGFFVDGENSVSFVCDYARTSAVRNFKSEDGIQLKTDAWLAAVKHRYQYEIAKRTHPYDVIEREFEKTPNGVKQHIYISQ